MGPVEQARVIIQAFGGNPFGVDQAVRERAEAILREADLSGIARAILKKNLIMAKSFVLSVGHRQACLSAGASKGVLGPGTFERSIMEQLPRRSEEYLRIVVAAGRCHAALVKLAGSSELLSTVRHRTWAACFGDSLVHALELERVIRDHDVLIFGETGTVKELVARAIQAATPGPKKGGPAPSASLNAAAIPDTLVESELFGHVKGAFTGATETRVGRIRSANGGSLFLDEVGDLPKTTQVKLLRVIETNEVFPLGTEGSHRVDVRYVAATHKDLEALAEEGSFRRDLFERLAGNVITVPPLRERPDDMQAIGELFIATYLGTGAAQRQADAVRKWLSSSAAQSHDWPGNVRELHNALRNLLLGLPPGIRRGGPASSPDETPPGIRNGVATMRQVEDWYMRKVFEDCGSNYAGAAKTLAIDRSTVKRRLGAARKRMDNDT